MIFMNYAHVWVNWDIKNISRYDLDLEILEPTPQKLNRGIIYWQWHFDFTLPPPKMQGGYMGIQLVKDKKVALFSIWDALRGKKPCIKFRHEGEGIQCLIDFKWQLNKKYRLTVKKSEDEAGWSTGWTVDGPWAHWGKLEGGGTIVHHIYENNPLVLNYTGWRQSVSEHDSVAYEWNWQPGAEHQVLCQNQCTDQRQGHALKFDPVFCQDESLENRQRTDPDGEIERCKPHRSDLVCQFLSNTHSEFHDLLSIGLPLQLSAGSLRLS